MSARPSQPGQRQPQRSLSGSGMLQRQAQQRSLLQQNQPSSPTRTIENFVDLTSDGPEPPPHRQDLPKLGEPMQRVEDNTTGYGTSPQSGIPKSGVLLPLPPRGKPRFLFKSHGARSDASSQVPGFPSNVGSPQGEAVRLPVPMPTRPGRNILPHARKQAPGVVATPKKDTRPKPYVMEVPASAPRYPPNGHADFFPWMGNHPEDSFTDTVIRQGHFDKSQTTQNETASARQTIYPALRQKNGLQTLGALFARVIGQRRLHGQITSTPTFKPPPRVTLTDTKRETWLRDLANPLIPLRRLSRTIPHGIKNKVLLEQCTSKRVPTERAVWLAKCVGANEIRASKRKGVSGTLTIGGESKWIRDWTACVEQFVESVITSCGEKEWKSKILYAVRLASHLYSEQLLDLDHYLDWLLGSLESTPLSRLPIWLLITEIYWDDILRYRKSGRRLVAALCFNLQAAHESSDRDILLPLIERVVNILTTVIRSNSESFIGSKTWTKYRNTLWSCNVSGAPAESPIFATIDRRNVRLNPRSSNSNEGHIPRRQVIDLLDSSLSLPFSPGLSKDCWRVLKDRSLLAQTLLDWATSANRPGLTKIFVAARLMRLWSRHGIDVDEAILNFLTLRTQESGVCTEAVYHLISELARSSHFSTSKYIQWIIARGGLHGFEDVAVDGPCATRLLAELPIHDLPGNLIRLRRTLLNRASFSVEDETETIDNMSHLFERCIPCIYGKTLSNVELPTTSDIVQNVTHLSRTVKAELGLRLRKQINLYIAGSMSSMAEELKVKAANAIAPSITLADFNFIRGVLEATEDLAMLADILKLVSGSSSSRILASITDTLNLHHNTFSAIGALKDLFEIVLDRQCSLAVIQSPESRILLNSLCELSATIPDAKDIHLQLSQEVARNACKTAVDACSPVSDHVAEVLQKSDGEFSDEIEKLLSSGNSMDAPTLARLFQVVITQIELSWTQTALGPQRYGVLLERLRTFDTKHFDTMFALWLEKMVRRTERPSLSRVLGPLISAGCLGFRDFLNICVSVLQSSEYQNELLMTSRIAFESLSLALSTSSDDDIMSVEDAYTLNIKRSQAQLKDHSAILTIIRRAVELSKPPADGQEDSINALCHGIAFRSFLQRLVLTEFDCVIGDLVMPLSKSQDLHVLARLRVIVRSLLGLETNTTSPDDLIVANRIEIVFSVASDLTLPFCQLALQSIFASERSDWTNEDTAITSPLQAFERAVDAGLANNNSTWTKIIPMLDIQIARHLCERAERTLLDVIPSTKLQGLSILNLQSDEELARKMLFVMDTTAYSMQNFRNSSAALQIVDKLNSLVHTISQPGSEIAYAVIERWLPLMLEFITIQTSDLDTSKQSSELRARILLALSTIFLSLQSRNADNATLRNYTFDVCLMLVDELPDDARLQCIRFLTDKSKHGAANAEADPALRYIFGFGKDRNDCLMLSQKGKMVPFPLRRWENLSEPTPMVGENDTALSLSLFQARRA